MVNFFLVLLFSLRLQIDTPSGACEGKKLPRLEDYHVSATYKGRARLSILLTSA